MKTIASLTTLAALLGTSSVALAQDDPPIASPTGKVDGPSAMVKGPSAPADDITIEKPKADVTTVTLSAGGQWQSGNSKLLAGTVNGQLDKQFGLNEVGAQLVGNFGEGAPAGQEIQTSTENIQGRVRYDRFLNERLSAYGMVTGRYDRFQGIDLRLNLDPGVKYIVIKKEKYSIWGELGYDLEHTIRRQSARYVPEKDASGNAIVDPDGTPVVTPDPNNPTAPLLRDKTYTDHSARVFAGYRQAFNSDVTASAGLEYLQSFRDGNRYRLNFDALLAAKIYGGLSAGFGFSLRFDNAPIKEDAKTTDTSMVVSLIYAFSNAAPPPAPTTCVTPTDLHEPPPPASDVNAAPAASAPSN